MEAAVWHLFGVPQSAGQLAEMVCNSNQRIREVMLSRTTQTNDPGHCAVLLPPQRPGRNVDRTKIMRLRADPAVQPIVVVHRDRIARCGCVSIMAAVAACARTVIVVDQAEMKDDFVEIGLPPCAG